MVFRYIICIFCTCLSFEIPAQEPNFYHYTTNEGLPSNECYNIMQDSKGYIWIATDRGVCRYDGYLFKSFTSADGLTDNTVFQIKEDERGRIWFMTFNGKLCWYKDGKIGHYKYNKVLQDLNNVKGIIRSFTVDKNDRVTLSYLFNGLVTIDAKGSPKRLQTDENDKTGSFFANEIGGKLFLGSNASTRPRETSSIFSTNIGGEKNHIRLQPSNFSTYDIAGIRRKNGNIIIAVQKNIAEISGNKLNLLPARQKQILTFLEDHDSCLWTGMYKGGVMRQHSNKSLMSPSAGNFLQGLSVTSILQDSEQGYWFTTLEDGIYYLPSSSVTIIRLESLPYKHVISSLAHIKDEFIYAGTSNGILFKVDASTKGKGYSVKRDSIGGAIETLYYDSLSRKLWVGTSHRLVVISKDGRLTFVSFGHSRGITRAGLDKVICLKSPNIWVVDPAPIKLFSSIGSVFRSDVMYTDPRGVIWVGTANGLYYFKNARLIKDSSIGAERIVDISSFPGNRLVVAIIGGGIIIRGPEGNLRINAQKGLISDIVNSICVHGKEIWVATNKGISRIYLKQNGTFTIRNFNQNQGLPTPDIKKILVAHNRVWLGTSSGLITFEPAEKELRPVPIQLESVKVNAIETNKHTFSPREDFVEFNFKGISFRQHGRIVYRYRLIGSSELWNETENTTIQFAALRPGNYSFELIARNADGIWNTRPFVFPFTIESPLWQKPFFIITGVSILLCIAFIWYRLHIHQIRKRNKLVLQLQEYQRLALVAQINPHFIFNSLNSIHAFVLNENRKGASKYLSTFSKLIRKCLDHSSKTYVPLNDEYELLLMYLDLEVLRFKNKFTYAIEVDQKTLFSGVEIPSMLLQPFIENAIYHGLIPLEERKGMVVIRIYFDEHFLVCEIEDNGIGREQAKLKKQKAHESKGTEITENRMRAYTKDKNYEFYLKITDLYDNDKQACGTRIVFHLPYRIP